MRVLRGRGGRGGVLRGGVIWAGIGGSRIERRGLE